MQNQVEMRKKWMIEIDHQVHKFIQNSSIFGQKKITSVLDCSQPFDVLCTYYELTPLTCVLQFCNMGKEQNLEAEMLDAAQA